MSDKAWKKQAANCLIDDRDDDFRVLDWLSRHWVEVYLTTEQGQPYRTILNGTGDVLKLRILEAMKDSS